MRAVPTAIEVNKADAPSGAGNCAFVLTHHPATMNPDGATSRATLGAGRLLKRLTNPSRSKTWRRWLTAVVLLAGILSMSELARTSSYFGLSDLTHRVVKLNRIGEPCAELARELAVLAWPETSDFHPVLVAVAPLYFTSETPRPSLTLSQSSNPFRSPPGKA